MNDAEAARKQAEGAHRHLEGLATNDPAVRFCFYFKKFEIGFLLRKSILEKFLSQRVMHHVILIQKNTMLKLKNLNEVC
jgi:hypothetical protein